MKQGRLTGGGSGAICCCWVFPLFAAHSIPFHTITHFHLICYYLGGVLTKAGYQLWLVVYVYQKQSAPHVKSCNDFSEPPT
mmetsp:Transcript_44353/g.76654  ORF Transcript_44353/g.76654 Transcript_44353/m.76654 type:complete len:81 (+) Transcript_44353:405-647(+)